MAGNPLCVGLAATAVGVEITWMNWAVAAIVPGLISLFLVPVLMLKLSPPEIRDIPDARDLAINELEKMGPMSLQEKVLAFVFVMCLALWATGSWTKLGATPCGNHADCKSFGLERHPLRKRCLGRNVLDGRLGCFGYCTC